MQTALQELKDISFSKRKNLSLWIKNQIKYLEVITLNSYYISIINSLTREYSLHYLQDKTVNNYLSWCMFEISELVGLYTFSWVPQEEHVFQKIISIFFKKFYFIKIYINNPKESTISNFGTLYQHISRSKLDLFLSKKIKHIT